MAVITLMMRASAAAQYRIDTWTTEQGLPQNVITDILQTRDGFLWLTTFGGLVRYDGANFHVFNTTNAPGMTTTRLTGLFEAPDGALWVSTEAHGAIRYDRGSFRALDTADGLPDPHVNGFFAEGSRAVLDTAKGAVEWDGARFVPYRGMHLSLADPRRQLLTRPEAAVSWYHDETGIHRFEQGRITRSVAGLDPRRAFEDRAGRLWMESQGRQLQCLLPSGAVITYTEKDGVPKFATAAFSEDRDGTLWFGFRTGGLLRFDGTRFTHYTTADGLPSDVIGRVVQDREGTRWVPTNAGLARFTARAFSTFDTASGLEADNTYPILQTSDGDVFIGGWMGLTRYHNGTFSHAAKAFGIEGENALSLAQTRDGALWIGMWGGGVERVKDGVATRFLGANGAPGTVVRAMLQTRDGTFWAGGPFGLSRLDGSRFAAVAGYDAGEVHALYEDRAGTLWIGTDFPAHWDPKLRIPRGQVVAAASIVSPKY